MHFALGYSLFAENRFKESIDEFKKVLVVDPGHGESLEYINKAENILQEKTGMKEDRIDRKLDKMRALFKKGQDLFKQKKYNESIDMFEKVLQIDPMHTESMKYIIRAKKELDEQGFLK